MVNKLKTDMTKMHELAVMCANCEQKQKREYFSCSLHFLNIQMYFWFSVPFALIQHLSKHVAQIA